MTSPICTPETDDFGTFSVIFCSAFSRRALRNAHHSPATGTIAVKIRKTGLTNLILQDSTIADSSRSSVDFSERRLNGANSIKTDGQPSMSWFIF